MALVAIAGRRYTYTACTTHCGTSTALQTRHVDSMFCLQAPPFVKGWCPFVVAEAASQRWRPAAAHAVLPSTQHPAPAVAQCQEPPAATTPRMVRTVRPQRVLADSARERVRRVGVCACVYFGGATPLAKRPRLRASRTVRRDAGLAASVQESVYSFTIAY